MEIVNHNLILSKKLLRPKGFKYYYKKSWKIKERTRNNITFCGKSTEHQEKNAKKTKISKEKKEREKRKKKFLLYWCYWTE